MNATFIANRKFIKFIKMLGFRQRKTQTRKLYFTNNLGAQIRIDLEYKNIALINKEGYTVEKGITFTGKEIDNFSNTFKIN